MIQQKEKVQQQYRDQQDHNTELSKRIDALTEDLEQREETIQQVKLSKAEVEAEKQHILTQLTEIQNSLQSEELEGNKQRIANETQMSEMLERIRGKELVIDQNSHEIRQLQSKLKSQETSIAYFKRQIQELEENLEQEKGEKQSLKQKVNSIAMQENERLQSQSSMGNEMSKAYQSPELMKQTMQVPSSGDASLDQFKMLLNTASTAIEE